MGTDKYSTVTTKTMESVIKIYLNMGSAQSSIGTLFNFNDEDKEMLRR